MKADPERQWFVYDNEKEMGPFDEASLLEKIQSGEITQTVFVFTDGMSDWTAYPDSELIKIAESNVVVSNAEGPPVESPKESAEKIETPEPKIAQSSVPGVKVATARSAQSQEPQLKTGATATAKKSASKKSHSGTDEDKKKKILTLVLAAILMGGILVLFQLGAIPGFESTSLEGVSQKIVQKIQSLVSGEKGVEPVPHQLPPGQEAVDASKTDPAGEAPVEVVEPSGIWQELTEFRKIEDRQGAPFRLSSTHVGGDRPVLLGVLSPLMDVERLHVAIFPDPEKSLYLLPPLWRLQSVPVDGYFSVGPLHRQGKALEAGRYFVLVASGGKFLGQVSFEVGPWPGQARLVERRKQLDTQFEEIRAQELQSLQSKDEELKAALEQIMKASTHAEKRKIKTFDTETLEWKKKLDSAIENQQKVILSGMVFPALQNEMLNSLAKLDRLYQGLSVYAKGGSKALKKEMKATVKALKDEAKKAQSLLAEKMEKSEALSKIKPVKLDTEIVKNQLLTESEL